MNIEKLLFDSNEISQLAAKHRELKLKSSIGDLLSRPSFTGFASVDFITDISVVMYISANDDGVALRCLWNGEFEPMSMAIWAVLASEAGCIFDIGAHSGIYSLVANAVSRNASVISFEPYPLNFARLIMNLRINEFPSDKALNIALSNQIGVSPFSAPAQTGYLTTGGKLSSTVKGHLIPVGCETIDHLSKQNSLGPDLLKIDVEGHELSVLAGGAETLSMMRPDLVVESVFHENTDKIEEILKPLGYSFYLIHDENMELMKIDHLSPTSTAGPDMACLNRLATTKTPTEVKQIYEKAVSLLGRER